MNDNYRKFFESVRGALDEGLSLNDVVGVLLVFGSTFGFGLGLTWFVANRRTIQREIMFFVRLLRGLTTSDSRRYNRIHPIVLIRRGAATGDKVYTVNISPKGMYVKMFDPIEVNSSFEFILELPQGHTIEGVGLVRWAQKLPARDLPRGMGVEFIKMSDADKNKIRNFLKSRK